MFKYSIEYYEGLMAIHPVIIKKAIASKSIKTMLAAAILVIAYTVIDTGLFIEDIIKTIYERLLAEYRFMKADK